ncbi:MAG: carotenoid 1,2-hydratase [Proteobacteria bacterium]|nr:carotenoid 1,2-hydratase [Pseudomonadota bacterium]
MNARLLFVLLASLISACSPDTQTTPNAITGLRLDNILGQQDSEAYTKADQARTFTFPADHGPHNSYRSEWWYLTAALHDRDGNEYGLHFTLFRQALAPQTTGDGPWHTAQAYLGHLAITDVSRRRHLEAERFARGHPQLAGVTTGEQFHALIEDWSLAGSADGNLQLALVAEEAGKFSVELQIQQTGPVVLQGDRGLSHKGPGNASYYYSIPRLQIAGQLKVGDRSIDVSGPGWLDREWSTSVLGESVEGWDWFSLQLQDQRSIMAFRLRRLDGKRDVYDHGLLVNHPQLSNQPVVGAGDAGVKLLTHNDFSLTPTRFYQDSRGIQWPVSWQLQLGDESFAINALLDQQTMELSILYWEGLVEVLDSVGNRKGLGYMELTGYGQESSDSR